MLNNVHNTKHWNWRLWSIILYVLCIPLIHVGFPKKKNHWHESESTLVYLKKKTKLVFTANNERSVNFYMNITFWPSSKIHDRSRFYLMLHQHFILWIVKESFLKYDFLFKEGYTQFVVLYIFFRRKWKICFVLELLLYISSL